MPKHLVASKLQANEVDVAMRVVDEATSPFSELRKIMRTRSLVHYRNFGLVASSTTNAVFYPPIPSMNRKRVNTDTEQIWRELSERLRQFVRSRVGSAVDVDDILQSVFLRIHSRLDELRQADRLESWVFQITRNAIADHFRRKHHSREDIDSFVDVPEDADAENVHGELAGCLNALIKRLPDDQRRALSLYELDGISQKEIAERESISLSGAKSRIQRGRKSLEAMLKACCTFQFDRRGNVVEYESNNRDQCDDDCGCT